MSQIYLSTDFGPDILFARKATYLRGTEATDAIAGGEPPGTHTEIHVSRQGGHKLANALTSDFSLPVASSLLLLHHGLLAC